MIFELYSGFHQSLSFHENHLFHNSLTKYAKTYAKTQRKLRDSKKTN